MYGAKGTSHEEVEGEIVEVRGVMEERVPVIRGEETGTVDEDEGTELWGLDVEKVQE